MPSSVIHRRRYHTYFRSGGARWQSMLQVCLDLAVIQAVRIMYLHDNLVVSSLALACTFVASAMSVLAAL